MLSVEAGLASASSPFSLRINAESWCCWLFSPSDPTLGTQTCERVRNNRGSVAEERTSALFGVFGYQRKADSGSPRCKFRGCPWFTPHSCCPPTATQFVFTRGCGNVLLSCFALCPHHQAFSWFRSPSQCVSDSFSSRLKGWT